METTQKPFAPTAHHPDGPSTFPMRAECIDFEAPPIDLEDIDGEEEDMSAKGRGTVKHHAVAMLLGGDLAERQKALAELSDREREEVQFVVQRVTEIIEGHGYSVADIRVEQRVTLVDGNFAVLYFGTCDGEVGPLDFDWKFGEMRNYFAQLAGYALPKMEARGEARRYGYIIYGRQGLRRHERYVITRETAQTVVYGLLARRADPNRKPTPCQYCGWCAKAATCPAVVATPVALVERREDWAMKLPSPHVSQLSDPVWLGAARYVWKRYLEPWGNAVEFASGALAAQGVTPLGFRSAAWPGRTTVTDRAKALDLLQPIVGADLVWDAMDITLGGLHKAYAKKEGISEDKAKALINGKLREAGLLSVGDPSKRLLAEKDAEATIRAAIGSGVARAVYGPK